MKYLSTSFLGLLTLWAPSGVSEVAAGDPAEHPTPSIEFVGAAVIPGTTPDLSGDSRILENGEPRNRVGGFSALDYSGHGSLYAALSDRGPDDGAVGYPCRVQFVEIQIRPQDSVPVSAQVVRTVLLSDSAGRQFTGLSSAVRETTDLAHRLDPEGFRFSEQGFFLSDEYGPLLLECDETGRERRRFPLPAWYQVSEPNGDKVTENTTNRTGRASNRGLECLCLSADRSRLVALMQGPLIQDGRLTPEGLVLGCNCRLIEVELATGTVREYVYQMASELHGNSEICALDSHRYLVLERDSLAGEAAAWRRLIEIDLSNASDISGTASLPAELPPHIQPVARREFLDLLDPRWELAGASMPEKIEGLTFGPLLGDGRQTLLLSTDNDFESAEPSRIWVFALQANR